MEFSAELYVLIGFMWREYEKYIHITEQHNYKLKNKTARIMAKPWMFRLPFKVYGAAVRTWKNWIK